MKAGRHLRQRRIRVMAAAMAVIAVAVIQLPPQPAAALVVTFRDDHTVLAGGAPFFPIGIYGADRQRPDAALQEVADFGFNTVGTFDWSPGEPADGATREWLDQVGGHGLKTWVRAYRGMAVPDSGPDAAVVEQQLRAQVQQLRDHPSLLSWKVADEPSWNNVPVEDLRRGQAIVRYEDLGDVAIGAPQPLSDLWPSGGRDAGERRHLRHIEAGVAEASGHSHRPVDCGWVAGRVEKDRGRLRHVDVHRHRVLS